MSHYLSIRGIGQPIAYFPKLAIHLGCIKAAVLLGQMVYWHNKTENPLGVYKSAEEITEETGLSYKEQLNARKKLEVLGLITETYKRLDHRLYFKFNVEAFDKWFEKAVLASCSNGSSPYSQREVREEPKGHIVIQKNTTKNTTDIHTNNLDEILNLWTPDLHMLNSWLQRSGEKPMTQDEVNILLLEINAHYETQIKNGRATSNKMYSNFVKWVKGDFAKQRKNKPSTQAVNTRNVNQAWGEEQHYDPAIDDIDLGDLK